MPTKKTTIKKNVNGKERLVDTIAGKLQTALSNLKEQLGEKKFTKRIKKVARKLVAGIKETPVKKPVTLNKKSSPARKKSKKAIPTV